MRYLSLLFVLGLCIRCGGDSSSLISALRDSGAGGAALPGSGGHGGTSQATVTTGGPVGSGGWLAGGDGGYRATGGQGGGAGGATVVPPPDAPPLGAPDIGLWVEVTPIDHSLPNVVPDAADSRLDWGGTPSDVGIDLGHAPIDGPLIRGFDAELAGNMCPSAVTCCRRLASAIDGGIDGGSMAVCDDIARGDAWRCYEYLLTLQAQGLLCTDLPY